MTAREACALAFGAGWLAALLLVALGRRALDAARARRGGWL